MSKLHQTLDYRGPDPAPEVSPVRPPTTVFVVATAIFAWLVFSHAQWVRLARPGGQMFGPQDQYVGLVHDLSSVAYGIGMCFIGGAVFAVTLRLSRARGNLEDIRCLRAAAALGAGYALAVGAAVWAVEQVAGPSSGGPRNAECAAHIGVALLYPVAAGWAISRPHWTSRLIA